MNRRSEGVSNPRRIPRNVPHPIPYQGSKRQLAPVILSYFPDRIDRLIEPFAGSAAISLAAAQWGSADHFVINDANSPLAALWNEIIKNPHELVDQYQQLWTDQGGQERAFFDVVRRDFNATQEPGLLLYLLARCVKGAIRYNSLGEFNNSPDNRRKGATPQNMEGRILGASALLQDKATVSSLDYKDVLKTAQSSDLIYLDPPYQGVAQTRDQRYGPKVDHAEFRDQLRLLNQKECRYAVSYDGRTGSKNYADPLPEDLRLTRIEIAAGRSTQATLLGREELTYESLYLSAALVESSRDR